ncbi:mycothiol synthase [Nocardioides humilatus]|uniref:Mycothiol acetyltransferase n=1 Tax=Nocardioides humilatus TaxID=2607660 RepID=A0A5B1LNY9_9ACTN|nr:mycothiol synthase [Nocardioides humilatus]KAA1421490.1 mycothiol synthase [Nocardioides humilatus]
MTAADPLEAITAVRRACLAVDGHDPVDEAVHLRLKHHGLEGTEAWVEDDGFALRHDGALDLAVAPEARRQGLGGRLAALAMAAPGGLTAWSHGDAPAARALAARLGMARARELWVMRRPAGVLPEEVVLPGIAIRSFEPSDAPALLAVNAAAFAHHAEQGAMTAADLAERMSEPWFDPAGLLLAVDADGAVLGFHWTKRHDADHGEVYVLGVAPAAHGRGLGKALTIAGLRHLAERRIAEVLLFVESDNEPAVRLYSGLGFTHSTADTHVQYERASHQTQPSHETTSPR